MIYVEDILNIGLLIDPLRDIIMALESMERESHGYTSYQLDQAIFHKSQIQSWIIKFQIY